MRSSNSIVIRAPYSLIFPLAAKVEDWGRILPHYRYVKVLRSREASWLVSKTRERNDGGKQVSLYKYKGELKLVKMSAWRNIIPVTWVAVQGVAPGDERQSGRIFFRHVRGLVKGMNVQWTFQPRPERGDVVVSIYHDLKDPPFPVRLLGPRLIEAIVGRGFIGYIAGKTLRRIKTLAEGTES